MNRRAFIQGLIGLASMPMIAKYINVFKPAAVREGITQAADNTMSKGIEFYEAVIKRVIDEGTMVSESDRTRRYIHPDKPDINVELDLTSGDTAVFFETDRGSRGMAGITTDMEIGPASKELVENEEVYRMGGNEYYKDIDEEITGGVGSLEDWIKMKRGYAAGGRIGMFKGGSLDYLDLIGDDLSADEWEGILQALGVYDEQFLDYKKGGRVGMWKGGMPKGLWAAVRSIWNKYGDDAITTANEIKRPQNVVEAEETAQAIKDFNLRNPVNVTETVQIWEDPVKIRAAVDDIFPTGDYKYDAQMAAEALVENNPEVFGGKLYDDLDQATQMKVYGAVVEVVMGDQAKMLQMKKLSKPTKTLEGIEKTGMINISDPNVAEEFAKFMREVDPEGAKKIDQTVELMNFDPKGRKKNAKGGHIKDDADVSLTIIEIPDISESGVESLFKRR